MPSTTDIAIASEDWSPWLLMAPRIITTLGECIARASTKEASQISLGDNLPYCDLASNLVSCHRRPECFLRDIWRYATDSFKDKCFGTDEWPRGFLPQLDRIAEIFGNPAAERAVNRLLDRVKNDITVCDQNGRKTAAHFATWHKSAETLHAQLVSAQSRAASQVAGVERAVLGLRINSQRLQIETDYAKANVIAAAENHEAAITSLRFNSAAATLGRTVGAAVATNVSSFLSAIAASEISKDKAEKDDTQKRQREIASALENIEVDLNYFVTEKTSLGNLIEATTRVLELLAGLTENIISLLGFFKRMNVAIEEIINENESVISRVAEDAAKGIELNEFDIEDFRRSTGTMKKLSLSVNALSMLYAGVITNVINPGFALVNETSHYQKGNVMNVVGAKQKKIAGYLKNAEEKVKAISQEANRSLIARFNEACTKVPKVSIPRPKSVST